LDGTIALTLTTDWTMAARSGAVTSGDSTRWATAGPGAQQAASATSIAASTAESGEIRGAGRQRRFDESQGAGTMSRLHRHACGKARGLHSDMCGDTPRIKRETDISP
jgi:hypothetical protein